MSAARDEIFRRLREALPTGQLAAERGSELPADAAVETPRRALFEGWKREIEALGGRVFGPVAPERAAAEVAALAASRHVTEILAWDAPNLRVAALDAALDAAGLAVLRPAAGGDARAARERQAALTVGLTGAIAGLASTGSVVVASGAGQARAASLLPATCIVVLHLSDLYADLPSWMALAGARRLPETANIVVITGPSRTADIELSLVIGVHGPGALDVVVVDDLPTGD